jgi:UDP-4-amino-4,6-dideoxy-L-N-acetyl-beta-L-altrosamine transaminase
MSDKFIPYALQSISKEDIESVQHALSQPIITRGPLVETFEKEVAAYCEAQYAVAFNSGTAALMAAYFAAEAGPHDRVITSPNSFIATIGPGIQLGATPIFIDIDRKTGNMNLEQTILNVNHPQSKGKTIVVPVHFGGIAFDVQSLDAVIANHRTLVIEDAAHAIGSCYKDGSKVGSCQWSQMTIFSFHPAKTMTTGEGGIVTTNDPNLCERLKLYRANGLEKEKCRESGPFPGYYEVECLSGNYHFNEMQAALGLSQLKRLEQFVEKRKRLIDTYRKQLESFEHVKLMCPAEDLGVAYHLCVAQIDFAAYQTTRKAVMEQLHEAGIGTQVHYIPLYRHPFFTKRAGDISEYFPEMEAYYAQALSLPLYYDLTEDDVNKVVESLRKAFGRP